MNNNDFITYATAQMGKTVTLSKNIFYKASDALLYKKGDSFAFDGFLVTSDEQSVLLKSLDGSEDSFSFQEFSEAFIF